MELYSIMWQDINTLVASMMFIDGAQFIPNPEIYGYNQQANNSYSYDDDWYYSDDNDYDADYGYDYGQGMAGDYALQGWQTADMAPIDARYSIIRNPRVLYDFLSSVWCAETCAPRMRMDWSEDNRTLGQCSITSFLVQDIFGGEVYGILRPGGNFHC
jgi:hypothetical protein